MVSHSCSECSLTNQQYATSALHCLFFHPLSKYPGPILARFSGWPSFWHTIKGDRHIWLWQLHQVYGN